MTMNAEQECILPQPHHMEQRSEQAGHMDSGYYSDQSDHNDIITIKRVPSVVPSVSLSESNAEDDASSKQDPVKTSTKWDTGNCAKLQANATPVDEKNERQVRTYYPSLS